MSSVSLCVLQDGKGAKIGALNPHAVIQTKREFTRSSSWHQGHVLMLRVNHVLG